MMNELNERLAAAELAMHQPQTPTAEELAVAIDMSDWEPADPPCDVEYGIDQYGRLTTTYLPAVGPRLAAGADYSSFHDRLSAEAFLGLHGGWLKRLWGEMADAPDHMIRIAAANALADSASDDSWLTS